ncbi:MAG: hypothetical protein WDZ37_05515 [Solirubrobacterales bacterium]
MSATLQECLDRLNAAATATLKANGDEEVERALDDLRDEVREVGPILDAADRDDPDAAELRELYEVAADKASGKARPYLAPARSTLASLAESGDVTGALADGDALDELASLADKDRAAWEAGLLALRKATTAREVEALERAINGKRKERRERERRERYDADDGGLPRVIVNGRPLRDVSDDALHALHGANDPPALYVHGGVPAHVRSDEHGRHRIEHLREATMRGRLTRVANTGSEAEGGFGHVRAPDDLVRDLLTRGDLPFPPLVGVVESPVLRADGSVLATPGYDTATRLVYAPPPDFALPVVPEHPSAAQVADAAALLAGPLAEFPFDSQASRANALALVLTPILRPAIDGPVPLALLDSTKAGTGKGLLAGVVAAVATGRGAAMMAPPTREEEWRKTILAVLAAGPSIVNIDNVEAPLASPSLASALTTGVVTDRILGRSETLTVPQRATWLATGNNVRVGGDLARRCYHVRLDAKVGRPWQRSGFAHDPLLPWVVEHRGELLAAALTLGRAWIVAERPRADAPIVGGFEEWAHALGGVLAAAGVEGFLRNLTEFYEHADEEAAEWTAFLAEWYERFGDEPVSTAKFDEALHDDALGFALRETLPGELPDALHSSSFTRKLGKALAKKEGTRYGERELHVQRASVESRGGAVLWRVAAGLPETCGKPAAKPAALKPA